MYNKKNFLITNDSVFRENLLSCSKDIIEHGHDNVRVLIEPDVSIIQNDNYLGLVSGYLCDLSEHKENIAAQYNSAFNAIHREWPLPENITGSFSTVVVDKLEKKLVLCNDLIGVYPLYYYIKDNKYCISSSLIMIGTSIGSDIDEVGLAQATYNREYINVGSRTILKEVKRLLPGEHIQLDLENMSQKRSFDNTLFSSAKSKKKITKQSYQDYWKHFKNEIDYVTAQYDKTYLALSGGMDSRLLLGSLPKDNDVECLTYGTKGSYEIRIASKLAEKNGHAFRSFSDMDLYFPDVSTLETYVYSTEAVNVISWLEILENVEPQKGSTILLGDMCEALPARNIKTYSSRKSRIANFFKTTILSHNYEFTNASKENFEAWKQNVLDTAFKNMSKNKIDSLGLSISYDELKQEIIKDFNELFTRIESHELPYMELFDELYNWYTHCRLSMGKQILLCRSKFNAICPPMSMAILRQSSNIHPNDRLNYRFMNKMFKTVNDLKKINRLPTTQSPVVPHSFPNWLIFMVWGLRSKIDQYLIKRLVKKKDPELRYRLFESINWVKVYQNDNLENKMASYFKNNHLGKDVYQSIKERALGRKKMERWPFTNFDIISLSALNIKIGLIKQCQNASTKANLTER